MAVGGEFGPFFAVDALDLDVAIVDLTGEMG
jgi:hypothetical protein